MAKLHDGGLGIPYLYLADLSTFNNVCRVAWGHWVIRYLANWLISYSEIGTQFALPLGSGGNVFNPLKSYFKAHQWLQNMVHVLL